MAATKLKTVIGSLGPKSTPQEIRDLRKSSWDFHKTYGMPVIHKHKWNARDVSKGYARLCPYHQMPGYESDYSNCPYCFGTGILGGWADGTVAYVTFADTQENRIRIGPQGVLLFDREPQMTAPWLPEMGNGDLLITGDFESDTFDIIEERDRYTMKEVTPVTVRGFQGKVQTVEYRVNQTAMVDRVPDFDRLYEVPIIFDYGSLPDVPTDPTGTAVSVTVPLRIVGAEVSGRTNFVIGLRIFGGGTNSAATRSLSIIGVPSDQGDVDVYFPPET